MYDDAYDEYGNPIAQQYTPPPVRQPYLSPLYGQGATFTQQSQGNLNASTAAGHPVNLPVDPNIGQPMAMGGGPQGGNYEQWFNTLTQGRNHTPSELIALEPMLGQYGVKVLRNAKGIAGKIQLPDGSIVDVLEGADAGGRRWQWLTGGGGGSADPSTAAPAIDPSYLAPFTGRFDAPADAALPNFQGPGNFQMPTGEDVLKDPGYLFRRDQGRDILQNAASARGLTNSGGSLAEIAGYGDQLASQEFGQMFNRKYGLWNADWAHALDEYGTKVGRSNTAYTRALDSFQDERDQFFKNQDRPFQKIMTGIDLGSRMAAA